MVAFFGDNRVLLPFGVSAQRLLVKLYIHCLSPLALFTLGSRAIRIAKRNRAAGF